jgi:hypothetical protein
MFFELMIYHSMRITLKPVNRLMVETVIQANICRQQIETEIVT